MGSTLMRRVQAWWLGLPLMRAFLCYTLLWACAVLAASVLLLVPLTAAYEDIRYSALADTVEINSGPYLYDSANDELVPAVTVELDTNHMMFLGIAGLADRASEASIETDGQGGRQSVYATYDMLVDDSELKLFDWGGNYTEEDFRAAGGNPYNPEPIVVSELATYDEQECISRIAVDGDVANALGAGGGLLVSNVGYYVSQPTSHLEGSAMVLRLIMISAPFVAGALLAVLMFRRFYACRMLIPLGALRDAANHIARQDLDFVTGDVAGREFGELAQAFESMRSSLRAAQRALWETAEERRRLNAAFAHDLRTPLTVLKGSIEMMRLRLQQTALPVTGQRQPGSSDDAAPVICEDRAVRVQTKLLDSADVLASQVAQLEDYCQAMTSVTKLEERPVTRRAVGYVRLTDDLEHFVRSLVEASGHECSFAASSEEPLPIDNPDSACVCVDEALVEEVLGNLVSNACRFAAHGVKIKVDLLQAVKQGQRCMHLQVKVVDDGPGFSADALRHGCEAFFSEQKSAEHFGLGLSIASTLARLHGGVVTLSNERDGAVTTAVFDVSHEP